jgi:hypothetical protein
LVAIASPNVAPAAANHRGELRSAARIAQRRQSATKKVNQLSVVKKWASCTDIGASATTAAATSPAVREKTRAPMA